MCLGALLQLCFPQNRSWKFDPSTESYVIVSTSVSHPRATLLAGVRCTELAMRYLIETTADGNSQLSLYCRVDMRYVNR